MFARIILVGSILTATATAGAQPALQAVQPTPSDPAGAIELHVNGGLEITGGAGALAAGARGRVSLGKAFGSGSVRPSLALGVLFGAGALTVEDPRALDGGLAIGYRSYGPEAQVALRFVNGGKVDTRLFGSFAVMRVDLDERLMYDAVPGVGGNAGLRASVGINWADRMGITVDDGTQAVSLNLLLLVPHQVEVVWERDAGSSRYGAMFAWGI